MSRRRIPREITEPGFIMAAREEAAVTAKWYGVDLAAVLEVARSWLYDLPTMGEFALELDDTETIHHVELEHTFGWKGFLADEWIRDSDQVAEAIRAEIGAMPLHRLVSVTTAAELLRVDVGAVLSVLLDWTLQSPNAHRWGVWDGDVLGPAGLLLVDRELRTKHYPNGRIIQAAREWAADAVGTDPNGYTADDLSDTEVHRFVDRTYVGGWKQFLADAIPVNLSLLAGGSTPVTH